IITSLTTAGTLELSGNAVLAGATISFADIGNLVYTPDANVNGVSNDSFSFQVQDDGGTNDGGQDTDQSLNSFTFNVASVNDEPAGTDGNTTILEDDPY